MRIIRNAPKFALWKPCWRTKRKRRNDESIVRSCLSYGLRRAYIFSRREPAACASAGTGRDSAGGATRGEGERRRGKSLRTGTRSRAFAGNEGIGRERSTREIDARALRRGRNGDGHQTPVLLKKPDAFQLGSADPDSAKVQKTIAQLGIGRAGKMPKPMQLVIAQLAFANSDLAFQGNRLFQGNFYGLSIYDISNPAKAALVTSLVCPGGQGDLSVHKNLLFMSVEMPNGRLDCGMEGFPPEPPPPADEEKNKEKKRRLPAAQNDRFRGVRIFDISDIKNPKQVAAVQTCRGSHTHTLVVDPNDKENVYIYVSGTSFVRQSEELAGCSGEKPDKDPNTALFRIDVIQVPVAAPQNAKVVSSPRVFIDPRTGALNGLNNGGTHGKGGEKPEDTDQCHDITVYSAIGLAAGACSGNGILLDIKDPVH